jgi:glycosyltransferase involved in cell wall biosynthesis
MKLKILWLNWRCWLNPAMGGAEVFTYEVAKRMAAMGHELTLFTSRFPGCKSEETVDGVKIVRAGGRFTVYRQAKKIYSERFRNEDFDIVIDEINTRPFFAPKFIKNKEKVVALIHQLAREFWFYETPFPASHFGYYFFEDRWLKQYTDVPTVTVSESTKNDLVSLGFKKTSIVPEGLNFKPLIALPDKNPTPVVAFSGRLKPAKRPDHAIKAFAIVKKKIPDAELWVFGDGPLREKLQKSTIQGVKFFGQVNNSARRMMLAKSWVLAVPGLREGWGLNVIEANALGTPCVAYDVPGLKDSVRHQDTGLLVESGNIEEFAEKIANLIENSNKRQELSLNALAYAREFDWDITANQFISKINSA